MKILVAMSGGVDSAVAAKLLKDAGHECIGCTMHLYDNEDAGISRMRTCCSLRDVDDARYVAAKLDMPYYVLNFKDDFRTKIINKFISCYESGITPNPCIDCNRYMKFDKLMERADMLSCDKIATGHYAKVEKIGDRYILKKAIDLSKDQSYVLYCLTQSQLSRILFPLGDVNKSDTRLIASKAGFTNADKPDSQDICFVPDGDYAKIIKLHTGKEYISGDYIDKDGNILGKHKGIIYYTIGQHKGLGISTKVPLYVKSINAKDNTIMLCTDDELYNRIAYIDDFNWISGNIPSNDIRCTAKVRYRQMEQPATAHIENDGKVILTFDKPQRAITPGQAAVLYDGDVVLGGGIIIGDDNA